MVLVVSTLAGLILGSFLNVVAHRLPRRESLVAPGSRCPGCGTGVRPYDNVPVLSWLLLGGRCRSCHVSIPARYPVVEALTAVLFAAVVAVHGLSPEAALGLVLVATLVPVSLIDLDHRIIPNRILGPAAVTALATGLLLDPGGQPERLIAAAGAGGFFLAAALIAPRGMGMGDVKLAAVLGLFLGREVGLALLAALALGSLVGAAVIARRGARQGRKTAIPFGPFLAAGGVVALLAGEPLLDWYVGTFA
jgi:leader peptidase (prepilin peptidase) / N-methyltransferase